MKRGYLKYFAIIVFISATLFWSTPNSMAGESGKDQKFKEDLMERIDFGNSYILGQSIKSGAVYLLHRKKSDIKSMLEYREDYRKEILEDFKVEDES